jgi:predicted double-glycine peptidase
VIFGELAFSAKLYEAKLESGNIPENPPRAITTGGNPATAYKTKESQTKHNTIAAISGIMI